MSVRSRNYKIIIQRDSNALTTRVIQLLDAGDAIYDARDTAVAAAASASASATQAEGIVTSAQDTIDQAVEAAQTAQEAAEAAMSAVVSPFVEGVIGNYNADHPSQNQIILRGSFAGKQAIDLNLGYGADQYPSGFNLTPGSDADGEYTVISPASGDWPIGMAFYARGVYRSASDPAEAADRAEAAAQAAEAAAATNTILTNRITRTIGPTGDFPTINAFLTFAARARPLPDPAYVQGTGVYRTPAMITATLQPTFVMAEQVFLDGGDYSHVEIWGPSGIGVPQAIVTTIQRSAITKRAPGSEEFYPVFFVANAIGPRIRARFTVDASSSATLVRGVHVTNSRLFMGNGGIANCPERGFCGYDGEYDISSSNWDGAGTIGVRLANRVAALLTGVSAKGCGVAAGTGDAGERAGLHARGGTTINMHDADFSNTQGEGVILVGCVVYSENLKVTGCTTNGMRASASKVFMSTANMSGNAGIGIAAASGAEIVAEGVNVSGCGTAFSADGGSTITAPNANAEGCTSRVIVIGGGATINVPAINGKNCGGTNPAVSATGTATLNAPNCDFTGFGGTNCVLTRGINRLNFKDGKLEKVVGAPAATDIDYYEGATINMTGATGGWNGSTANALNGSRGIVWKQ